MSGSRTTPLELLTDNVFRARDSLAVLEEGHLEVVVRAALSHPLGRARINFHHSDDDPVHEMIIATTPRSSGPPHLHTSKSESFHLLSGALGIGFYDEQGRLVDAVRLDEGGRRYYRLSAPTAHMPIALSEVAVFHETTSGPFVRGVSSVYPSWAVALSSADIAQLEADLWGRLADA